MLINTANLTEQIKDGLTELESILDIQLSETEGIYLHIEWITSAAITIHSTDANIKLQCDSLPAFYKAISMLAANCGSLQYETQVGFKELGAMLDCSRNGVLSVTGAKLMIRYFAVMGYNYIMLYTEDTIELKEYPYFGYLRGRYSKMEISEIQAYCDLFGIELVPCIQTLAHLNQAFRWDTFREINDIDDILLAGDDRTYQFLDCLIRTCSEYFKSRRIHIGMDEANHFGLGKYLQLHGLQNRMEAMLRHLERVITICKKYELKPMMWSDMFFHLTDSEEIPQQVIDRTPKDVALVYWNYYSQDKERYKLGFEHHLKFDNEIVFAAGSWSWGGLVPDNRFSIGAAKAALPVAKEKGLQNVLVTMWGDDGTECSFLSLLPSLMVYSELNYSQAFNDNRLEKHFRAMTGIDYQNYLSLETSPGSEAGEKNFYGYHPAKYLLFQDAFAGIFDLNLIPEETASHYRGAASRLNSLLPSIPEVFNPVFRTNQLLCEILSLKADLGLMLRSSYRDGNKAVLNEIANSRIPSILTLIEEFHLQFQKTWLQLFKPFGWEIQDLRYGGLLLRLKNVKRTLHDYLEGRIESIAELEEDILPYGGFDRKSPCHPYADEEIWRRIVSVNVLSHN